MSDENNRNNENSETDDAFGYPVTWREFGHIIIGLKARAQGKVYDGPQAHWVNQIWDEILTSPDVPQEASETEEKPPTAVTRGSARERLRSLSNFANSDQGG